MPENNQAHLGKHSVTFYCLNFASFRLNRINKTVYLGCKFGK